MDKGPNGTIEKFPARKNNDFMIKVLKTEANTIGNPASHSIDALGLKGIEKWQPGSAFPNIQFGTNGLDSIGGANNVPGFNNQPTYDISDNLSISKGKHTFSMGFGYKRFSIYNAG